MAPNKPTIHLSDDRLHRSINWELIRGFGQSPIATLSIALPFIGYAILYHDQIQLFLQSHGAALSEKEALLVAGRKGSVWSFQLDLLTRLNIIYLGGIFVGIGTIVYRIFAPNTIKKHASITEFSEQELSRATARRLRSMTATILSRRPHVGGGLLNVAPWLDRGKYSHKSAVAEFRAMPDEQIKYDVLSSYYNVESRYFSRPAVYITTFLYASGFLLLLTPGLLFALRVLRIVILGFFA